MNTIGIKELQTNPAVLTKSLEAKEYALITKRNKPLGIAFSIDDRVITDGLKTALMIDAYQKGYLSLGQLTKEINKPKDEVLKILSAMGIDVIDYDFKDDLDSLDSF